MKKNYGLQLMLHLILGRVHAGCASFEYLPCNAFKNRSYIEDRQDKVIILSGYTTIENEIKDNTNLNFDISNVIEETKLELPYIYYLGYNVTLINNDEKINLKTHETENGFIGVNIPKLENASIEVKYTGTIIMKIFAIISIISTIIVVIYYIYRKLTF